MMAFSLRRRAMYKCRSQATSSIAAGTFTKTCSMCGSVLSASAPQALGSTGTARQPATAKPCSASSPAMRWFCGRRFGLVLIQEHHADGEALSELQTGLGGHRAHERNRELHQQAAAVAGLTVGGHRAAVGQTGQRVDGGLHQPMAGLAVHVSDEPETAAGFFEFGSVQTQ